LVRDQLASRHDRLGFKAELGATLYMIPQKIARRYLRDTVTVHNLFGLRALPGPGRPEKNHGSNISRGVVGRRQTSSQLSVLSSQKTYGPQLLLRTGNRELRTHLPGPASANAAALRRKAIVMPHNKLRLNLRDCIHG